MAFQPRPRAGLKAVLLLDGKVLTAGGNPAIGVASAGGEVFNPALATFSLTGFMNIARYNHGLTLQPDGRVLVNAGNAGSNTLDDCEVFDETLNQFTVTTSFPDGARELVRPLLLPNGKTLIAGGDLADPTLCLLYDPVLTQPSVAAFSAPARSLARS